MGDGRPDANGMADVEIKDFEGGLFAVLRCNGLATIEEDWGRLAAWVEAGPYRARPSSMPRRAAQLPGAAASQWVFDLFVAIAE